MERCLRNSSGGRRRREGGGGGQKLSPDEVYLGCARGSCDSGAGVMERWGDRVQDAKGRRVEVKVRLIWGRPRDSGGGTGKGGREGGGGGGGACTHNPVSRRPGGGG